MKCKTAAQSEVDGLLISPINIIKMIDHLIEIGYYDKPKKYHISKFKLQSYNYWALHELRRYIYRHRGQNVVRTIEKFCHQMDLFSCTSHSGDATFVFAVAYDVGMDILDRVCVEMEWRNVK